MLLVDEDHADVPQRGEQRRPGSHGDGYVASAKTLPLGKAFARAQSTVQHGELVAEAGSESPQDLMGERDLGNQDQGLSTRRQRVGDGPEVDLGLAASGDAVEKEGLGLPATDGIADFPARGGLLVGEYDGLVGLDLGDRAREDVPLFDLDEAATFQGAQRRAGPGEVFGEIADGLGPFRERQHDFGLTRRPGQLGTGQALRIGALP